MIALALACHTEAEDASRRELPPPCETEPCVATLGQILWEGPDYPAYGGYSLALHEGVLLVGAPVEPQEDEVGHPFVEALSLDGGVIGTWYGEDPWDLTGVSLAVTDLEGDGLAEVAIGDPNRQPSDAYRGAVHLLSGLPSGDQNVWDEALFTFHSPEHVRVGGGVQFADILVEAPPVLLASGPGMLPDWPGCVYALDPSLRGNITDIEATRTLCGEPGLGTRVATWDGDLDGQLDLLTSTQAGIGWFRGPWETDITEDDVDVSWTQDITLGWDIQEHLRALKDVTGDGEPDLTFAAANHGDPAERAGRAYVVPAGDLQPGPADELSLQVRGTEVGDGMGYGLQSGDIDGDGQHDLLVAASGVFPGKWPGKLLVYRGPLSPGVYEAQDADAAVHGEYVFDYFGRAIETTDLDADGQEDVFVSAMGWPAGENRGAVYLVHGADLLP
jgi:hypothetical protein